MYVQSTLTFVSIRQPLSISTDNASFKQKNIRVGSPRVFMSIPTALENNFFFELNLKNIREIISKDDEYKYGMSRERQAALARSQPMGRTSELWCPPTQPTSRVVIPVLNHNVFFYREK